MLGRTGVAHYGRRCSWAHSEGHIGVAHYGILVGGPLQLRWQPIGRRCLWAHLGGPFRGGTHRSHPDLARLFFSISKLVSFKKLNKTGRKWKNSQTHGVIYFFNNLLSYLFFIY